MDTEDCQRVTDALDRIGSKWSVLVMMQLDTRPKRFNELRRAAAGISQKMLASTLRGLERDGFVTRTVLPTSPPGAVYALTDLGGELVVPITALGAWVLDNVDRIESARHHFDTAQATETLSPPS
ncbi:helix-turn-helix domain-containing protein [Streptomyces sp. NPDC050617]|uniref:winged helix-turn-helix transcriptional regulator n=1 Tax=Streptomyces sp. NPDC050617 TaxID=3154628 RepID=UPI00344791C6